MSKKEYNNNYFFNMVEYDFLNNVPVLIMEKEFHHYSNIINASTECIKKLEKYTEIVLVAETQSGKTEVIKRIIYIIQKHNQEIRNIGININRNDIFVVICSSSLALKNQLKNKLPELGNQIYHLNDINRIDTITLNRMAEGLIIFDECHCDAEQQKTIDIFRKKLKKTSKTINENINYHIIGTSATPYEQIKKKYPMVILEPGKNYYGIKDIFKAKIVNKNNIVVPIISQARNLLLDKNCKNLFDEIKILNRYYIIRLSSDKNNQSILMNNILKQFSIRHIKINKIIYDMSYSEDINNLLKNKPKLPTVIYIKDKLRMGNNLNTKYVYMVYDDMQNIHTHTTVQSLLGRCCGYNKKKHGTIIYCDVQKAKEHLEWIKSNFSADKIPHNSKYIMKSTGKIKDICIFSESS